MLHIVNNRPIDNQLEPNTTKSEYYSGKGNELDDAAMFVGTSHSRKRVNLLLAQFIAVMLDKITYKAGCSATYE